MVVDLYQELGITTVETPTILEDNRGVVLTANGTGSNPSNNKHVDVKYKHVQDYAQRGGVQIKHVGTLDNVADFLIKPLQYVASGRHYPYLGFDGSFEIRSVIAKVSAGKNHVNVT